MQPPSTSELLTAWENGLGQPPPHQALTLLRVASPDSTLDELARLSVGQRDAHLLELRESSFGPQAAAVAACPVCQMQLELDLDIRELQVQPQSRRDELQDGLLAVSALDFEVELRLPDSQDLAASIQQADVAATRQALLERCVVDARQGGTPTLPSDLPAPVVEAVEARLAEADPQADIRLALTCPDCAFSWEVSFDIVGFLWMELHAWACCILWEVHQLASAYGWRERDVLALTPVRRRFYLQAVGQ
jgi:hypothetical protein